MSRTPYVPPADDEPLDEVQLALVRSLIPIIADRIRAELIAEQEEEVAEANRPRNRASLHTSEGVRQRARMRVAS